MGLGGYGIPCGSCGCGTTTPTRYVVAARGWTDPYFIQATYNLGGSYVPGLCFMPSFSSERTGSEDDATWTSYGNWEAWSPPVSVGTGDQQGVFGGYSGASSVDVEVKWDGDYMWLRMIFESNWGVTYRKTVASSLAGSNVAGRVIFSTSDIYSFTKGGISSADYTGLGDVAFLAAASEPTNFEGKTFSISFSQPALTVVRTFPTGGDYFSIENLFGSTFEVSLSSVSSVPPYSWDLVPNSAGCYSNNDTSGRGRGCVVAVQAAGSECVILAGGSVTKPDGSLSSRRGCSSSSGPVTAFHHRRTAKALILHFMADWFDAFQTSGTMQTEALMPFPTDGNIALSGYDEYSSVATGFDAVWGLGGSAEITVA